MLDTGPVLDLSVLIPVYNEVENVGPLHAELDAVLGPLAAPLRADLRRRRLDRRDGGEARGRSRTPTPSTSGSPSCAATAARPPRCRRRSTWRGGRSWCRWTATARTTRPTSPGCSTARPGLRRRLGLAARPQGHLADAQGPLVDRQPPGRPALGRPAPRLRLHAEGLPPHGARRGPALRRDAPVHPDLRHLARRPGHRAGRQPPAPDRRPDQVRPRPHLQRRARPDPDPLLPALRPAPDAPLRPRSGSASILLSFLMLRR